MSVTVVRSVTTSRSAPYLVGLGMRPAWATLNNIAGPTCGFFTGGRAVRLVDLSLRAKEAHHRGRARRLVGVWAPLRLQPSAGARRRGRGLCGLH
eukprot:9195027-Pyramimonas_sp.AAC.1